MKHACSTREVHKGGAGTGPSAGKKRVDWREMCTNGGKKKSSRPFPTTKTCLMRQVLPTPTERILVVDQQKTSVLPASGTLCDEPLFWRQNCDMPARGPRKKPVALRRVYSSEEVTAWSARPRGCLSLADAIRLWKRPPRPVLRRTVSTDEFCSRRTHPLHTGAVRKLYRRDDFLSPVLDSLHGLLAVASSDCLGGLFVLPTKRARSDDAPATTATTTSAMDGAPFTPFAFAPSPPAPPVPPAPSAPPAPAAPSAPSTCRGCGAGPAALMRTREGNVCGQCGAASTRTVSECRQKLGASEADDKTQVADRVVAPRVDRFDAAPPTAQQDRLARLNASKTFGLAGARIGNRYGRLHQAQAICDRQAAKSLAVQELAAGIVLEPRERIRQRAVFKAAEDLFTTLAPIDHSIKRRVRILADCVFVRSCAHCHVCTDAHCTLRLCDRSASAVASAVLQKIVDSAVAECDNSAGERPLRALQNRMENTISLTNRHSGATATCILSAVDRLADQDFDATRCCTASATKQAVAVGVPVATSKSLDGSPIATKTVTKTVTKTTKRTVTVTTTTIVGDAGLYDD